MGVGYSIGAVARRTGLSVHALRAWERRYGVVEPVRSEGGERLYTEEDVVRLQILKKLTEAGHAIGRVAALDLPALRALLSGSEGPVAEAVVGHDRGEVDLVLADAGAALQSMDGEGLRAILMRSALRLGSKVFCEEVVIPLLRSAGDLWATDRICPAHEHVLSVELGRVLGWIAGSIPAVEGGRRAVAGTLAGDRHEFGAYLAAIVAAEEGWRVTYLGPDLPAADIATACRVTGSSAVLLSVVRGDRFAEVARDIGRLREAIGPRGRILVGGAGAVGRGSELAFAGARVVADLNSLRESLREDEER